jgi:hypothetical protein
MTRIRTLLALAGVYLMCSASACVTTTAEAPVKTVAVATDIATSCVPADMMATPSPEPPTAAALKALPDAAARDQALQLFWTAWAPWIPVAEGVLASCAAAGPAIAPTPAQPAATPAPGPSASDKSPPVTRMQSDGPLLLKS